MPPTFKPSSAADRNVVLGMAAAAAVGAGIALLLWRRRARPKGEQSLAEEVEAHPS